MSKLRKSLYVAIFGVAFLVVLSLSYWKPPLGSTYEETGIDGSKRYYELLNKHPRSHEEYEEFLEEKRKLNNRIEQFIKKRRVASTAVI